MFGKKKKREVIINKRIRTCYGGRICYSKVNYERGLLGIIDTIPSKLK